MAVEVKVPELAESISEASLLSWSRSNGDTIVEGEILAAIETDKIVLDVPAPCSGVLEIVVDKESTSVVSGQVLGRISEGAASQPSKSQKVAVAEQTASTGGESIEIKVPELAESIAEANLIDWKVSVGDQVARNQVLVAVETDKIVLDIVAPADGVVSEILKDAKADVKSMEVIARLSPGGGAQAVQPASPASSSKVASGEVKAMPSARKMAEEKGLSLNEIEGHGKSGRITKEDVLKAGVRPAASAALVPGGVAGAKAENRVRMTRLRAKVAERLLESQSTAAILSTFNEVNMQPVMELRKRYRDQFEKEWNVRLGFMSFFVKAAVRALRKYPIINASVEGEDIIYHEYYDIGIAVSSPRGLVVPILRDADTLSFAEIEGRIADYGNKARDGKLSLNDISGGTFSISNGGVFGSMLSTPIVNPPQSAILGVHATRDRPVAEDGQVVVRPMNYLALSYDHRIIDGKEAVLFLVSIKEALEDPARLLLDV